MAKEMLSFLTESSVQKRNYRRAIVPKLISVFIQLFAFALLIILPLMAAGALPTPEGIIVFRTAPLPPPPLPPRAPKAPQRPNAPRVAVTGASLFVAPVEIPDEIGADLGNDFGVPGGVDADVPIGVGVVGGLPEAPAPAPQEPVRIRGGNIQPPRKIKDVRPIYPDIARPARVSGIVILDAVIDPQGRVTNVRVLRSIPLLDQAAITAVRQWVYEPTLLNGVPVPIVMSVTVNFVLN